MFKFLKRFSRKRTLYEVDSTFYLFLLGLFLGVLFFFNLKALWIFFLYVIFIVSIIVHDLVQSYVAHKFGLKLKKYLLLPFGSKKMYGEDFERPLHEFVYALAGLLTYVFIFVLVFIISIKFFPQFWPKEIILQNTITAQTFDVLLMQYPLFSIFWVNFLLFVFNLFVFAVPLDGGRLLKAILTLIFGQRSANKFVPIISKIVAFVIVVLGVVFWDLVIVVIGIFVYFVSAKESKENEILMVLSDKTVNEFVRPVELHFKEDKKVLDCFEKMKEVLIPEAIIVYDKKQKYGVVDADKISKVAKNFWASKDVGDIAEEVMPTTDKERLGFIAQYMVEKNLSILPVIHSKTKVLIGIIKRADLADFLKIHKIFN